MKKTLFTFIAIFGFAGIAFALPYSQSTQTLVPFNDNQWDIGTSTSVYRNAYITQLCLSADCKTAWPSGGSGVWPFTPDTNYGVAVQSTTTPEWFKNGLMASSTSYLNNVFTINATTTNLSLDAVYADATDGIKVKAANGLDVANFGLANSQNTLLYGGLNVNGATRLATSLTGLAYLTNGAVSATGTPQLTVGNLLATSTTATSTFMGAVQIGATAANHALTITAEKSYATSISSGGMININNTLNDGLGTTFTTAHGSGATGRHVQVNCSSQSFDQNCLNIDSNGASPAVSIYQGNTSSAIGAGLNVQSVNPFHSAVTITGQENAKGTLKVTHIGNSATDSDSAALSIDLQATTTPTAAQGIYITSTTGGTTGKLLNIRNDMAAFGGASGEVEVLTFTGNGLLGVGTSTPTSLFQIAGQSAPKITLSDTNSSANQKHWFVESDTGQFSIGTTSDALITNTTYRPFIIAANGNISVGGNSQFNSNTTFLGNGGRPFDWGDTSAIGALTFTGTTPVIQALSGKDLYFGANGATSDMVIKSGGNVGIGTTTPYSKLSVWGAAAANTRMFELTNSASTTAFTVFTNGHTTASTTAPSLSSCGTSPTVNGTDAFGQVNVGATGTGCTITFASAYKNAPSCVVTSQGGVAMTYSMTNTALTLVGASLGGTSVNYTCNGLGG